MLSIALTLAITTGCGSGGGGGRVLAEETNLGEFGASPNPFRFDAAHARRFVIKKVEVFAPGELDGFPADCSQNVCPPTPDEWPIVVISTEEEPSCQRTPDEFLACASPLAVQCSLGEESPHPPTYIWWDRDSVGKRQPHSCAYSGIAHPSERVLLGFFPHVTVPPTHFSLVVQGQDVPIHFTAYPVAE